MGVFSRTAMRLILLVGALLALAAAVPPLSPTPNLSPGMAMATEATVMVATTRPTATATGERRKGLQWLSQSLTRLLNQNLMDTATMATTGPMGTGVGEGRRDLLSPMLRLNRNLTDMDIARMATTGPMDTGAGERRKGLLSLTMDMDTAVATMAVTVADIGAEQAK